MQAAKGNDIATLVRLLEARADVNWQDKVSGLGLVVCVWCIQKRAHALYCAIVCMMHRGCIYTNISSPQGGSWVLSEKVEF